jgi:PAS domain-containing protein
MLRDAAGPTHLQQIIAALTEGVIIVDPNGSLSWADETALRLHGVRSLKELGGTAGGFAERYQLAYRNAARLRPDEYPIQRLLKGETIDKALVEVSAAPMASAGFMKSEPWCSTILPGSPIA